MKAELTMLKYAAMPGISVWTVDDDIFHLEVILSLGEFTFRLICISHREVLMPLNFPNIVSFSPFV